MTYQLSEGNLDLSLRTDARGHLISLGLSGQPQEGIKTTIP